MLLSARVNLSLLQKAQDEYKQHAQEYTDLNEMIENCPALKTLVAECPSVIIALKEAFQQHNLQPSILTEYAAFSILAQKLGLNTIIKPNSTTCRCIYTRPQRDIELRQYGGCQNLDGEIYKYNQLVRRLEVKQKEARTMDSDLGVVKNGHIEVRDDIKETWAEYVPFIENINFWDHLGHNIKLNNIDINKQIASAYLKKYGYIEMLIFGDKGLYYMSASEYMQHLSYNKSEIRTCGKNATAIYNIDVFMNWLMANQGNNVNGIITLPFKNVVPSIARGGTYVSRYKMNYIFWVPAEKAKIQGDYISFPKSALKENKPNASIHAVFLED